MSSYESKPDTLARARRLAKQLERQKRTALRERMRGAARVSVVNMQTGEKRIYRYGDYDSPVTMIPATDYNPFTKIDNSFTLHDITQHLEESIYRARTVNHVIHSHRYADKKMRDVVCDEVKDVWRTKIGLASVLDDDVKTKLTQTRNLIDTAKTQADITRELRMTALARSFVLRWTETEGYDPDLHTPELREKFNEFVRSNP